MTVYFFNLSWVVIMSKLAVEFSKVKYNNELKIEKKLPNAFFGALILLSLMSIYALRWKTGTDFSNYYDFYFKYGKMNIAELIGTRDWGFYALTSTIYKFWPENFIFYNYVLAALTYIPIVRIYIKYSCNFTFTIILYITMMTYYGPYNGVRQGIAASICFFAYPLLYDKKYIKYFLYILLAYLFHSTSLLMIPLMFVVTRKAWSRRVMITLAVACISVIFLPNIWNYIINFLEIIGQEKMASDYQIFNYSDDGVNILRIAVALIPTIISFIFYKTLKANNSKIDILINMSLMYAVFMIFGSRLTVLARLSSYFSIFIALLIPEFTTLFKGKDRISFKVITLTMFFIYMIMLLPVDSNLLPYKFIINK